MVIATLVLTTGLHWAALQTVAWATMLASNACHESLSVAMNKTFDGRHPCCLCKAIAAGEKSEKKSEAVSPVLKMEFPPATAIVNLVPPTQLEWLPLANAFAEPLSFPPPLPPPRGFLA